jgi:hypothetical protein
VESRAYSERYIAGLVRSILRFIAQCHAKGIVYRDVKPGARACALVLCLLFCAPYLSACVARLFLRLYMDVMGSWRGSNS